LSAQISSESPICRTPFRGTEPKPTIVLGAESSHLGSREAAFFVYQA